jgi:hypothetical protein
MKFCIKLFGRRNVYGVPESSMAHSTGRWILANENASLSAPRTESLTRRLLPGDVANPHIRRSSRNADGGSTLVTSR